MWINTMTPKQHKVNYEGGRLARRNNMTLSRLIGSETLLTYRNYPEILSGQIKAYLDGYFDQGDDLAMEVS
jgi:hypothetical protein